MGENIMCNPAPTDTLCGCPDGLADLMQCHPAAAGIADLPPGQEARHASDAGDLMGVCHRRCQGCTQLMAGGGCRQALDGGVLPGVQPVLDAVGTVHPGPLPIVRGQRLASDLTSVPHEYP